VPHAEIERTLWLVFASEESRKRTILNVVSQLLDSGADNEPILATVRGRCQTSEPNEKETSLSRSLS
jgi:hypothetical protein